MILKGIRKLKPDASPKKLTITMDTLIAIGKWEYSNFKGTIQRKHIHWTS